MHNSKLFLLEYANIVYYHGDWKSTFVDSLVAAPVTTPREVENRVEGVVEWPAVVVGSHRGFGGVELYFPVYISGNFIFCPFTSINVEFSLCSCTIHLMGLLSALGVIVVAGME